MKNLLQQALPMELGIMPSNFQCTPMARKGLFHLSDAKTCKKCKTDYPERRACNEQTLIVSTTTPIDVLDFESYISQWDNTTAKVVRRCDYLMWNDVNGIRKVVFCDITCSVSEHVDPNPNDKHPEGKRQYSYIQMQESLDALMRIFVLEQYLLTATEKVFLFGWREPDISAQVQDDAEDAMASLILDTAIEDAAAFKQPATYHGFDFVQVKYPNPYEWQ